MKRRTFLATLAAGAVSGTALLGSLPACAGSFDDIVASGVLRVAVYRDYPPFSYEENGKLVGIDVDLAHEIGKAFGLRINFMLLTPADDVDGDLRNAVWKGHYLGGGTADLMLHVPFDPALATRNDNAVLFAPYYTENLAWASQDAAPGSAYEIRTESIGVENDSIADLYLAALQGGRLRSSLRHFSSTPMAARALRDGGVAAAYGPQSELDWALAGSDLHPQLLGTPGLIKRRWEIGMATKESLRDLMWAVGDKVDAMRRNGVLAAIFQRYHVEYRPPDEH